MSTKTDLLNALPDNTTFLIQGELDYGRLARQVSGAELQREQEKARMNKRNAITRPYTTASIKNAKIVYKNPGTILPEEQYAEQACYSTVNEPNIRRFQGYNKGNSIPRIAQRNPDGTATEIILEGELAKGLKVTLVMKVYKTNQPNKGLALEMVIIDEPIRYYNNGGSTNLSDFGITFKPLPAAEKVQPVMENEGPQIEDLFNPQPTPQTQPIQPQNPYTNQPQTPVQNPYGVQPQPTPAQPTNPNPYADTSANQNGQGGIVLGGNRNY